MLSVLIPVYNFEIFPLVAELSKQATEYGTNFEILCYDDYSDPFYKDLNNKVSELAGVRYVELEQNVGRAKIRNLLAEDAQFSLLLFMDCDSKVVKNTYLSTYLNASNPNTLLYGGRIYKEIPPQDPGLFFHWHYGRSREQQSADQRKLKPHQSFMTNNFLIPKGIFDKIKFNEQIREYGHEDTLFGLELKQQGVPILHIDNPLDHIGLESVDHFLGKSYKALKNLHKLSLEYPLEQEVRSLQFLARIKKANLLRPTLWSYQLLKKIIDRNLRSSKPKLKFFDFYKLAMLAKLELDQKHKKNT